MGARTAKVVIINFGILCVCSGIVTFIVLSKYTPGKLLSIKPGLFEAVSVSKHVIQGVPAIDISNLPLCPDKPPDLKNNVQPEERERALKDNRSVLQHVQPGGTYQPRDCRSREHVAIIVPYRDREEHLLKFVNHMHQYLRKQQLHYTIFVAEMNGTNIFNTGMVQNIGFVTADKADSFTCFIIHDVDLLPTNENNLYRCDDNMATHLAPNNSKYNYSKPYNEYFGGVTALRRNQFYKANGFSNLYFGWGFQDDDFRNRILHSGMKIREVPMNVGVYEAIPHDNDKGNPTGVGREKYEKSMLTRMKTEGLNSLEYKVIKQEAKELYTWILVEIDQATVMKNWI